MEKGNKPSFHKSASGDHAKTLYETFYKKVGDLYESDRVKDGVFAAMMDVALVNDGPVSVDYIRLDDNVRIQRCISWLRTEYGLNADQLAQVTIQIDTNPPKLEAPSTGPSKSNP